jgi:hypothetical protein
MTTDSIDVKVNDYLKTINHIESIRSNENGGRGKKQCPTCSNFMGVRTRTCECGYEFVKGEKTKQKTIYDENPNCLDNLFAAKMYSQNTGPIIYTPRGKCPVNLKDMDIVDWLESILCEGRATNCAYTPSAIKYFLRYSIDSKEFKELESEVDTWVKLYMEG